MHRCYLSHRIFLCCDVLIDHLQIRTDSPPAIVSELYKYSLKSSAVTLINLESERNRRRNESTSIIAVQHLRWCVGSSIMLFFCSLLLILMVWLKFLFVARLRSGDGRFHSVQMDTIQPNSQRFNMAHELLNLIFSQSNMYYNC